MTNPIKKKRRHLVGIIVSDKMQKTVVVKVGRMKAHPLYHKKYQSSKRYKVHVEMDAYKIGDRVAIEETRPLSKEKRWRVIGRV